MSKPVITDERVERAFRTMEKECIGPVTRTLVRQALEAALSPSEPEVGHQGLSLDEQDVEFNIRMFEKMQQTGSPYRMFSNDEPTIRFAIAVIGEAVSKMLKEMRAMHAARPREKGPEVSRNPDMERDWYGWGHEVEGQEAALTRGEPQYHQHRRSGDFAYRNDRLMHSHRRKDDR